LVSGELQLTLLGKLEVARDGVPVTGFAHKKSLALLCHLAVTGRPHTREALAGLLWGQATEANARAGLRKVLADLRRLVGSHVIVTRQQVAFDRERPYWLDVEVFERGDEIIKARERDGALTDGDAAALAASVELYQGGFLEGFYVRRAPAFEDWGLLRRERLRLLALRMLHTLAAHYAARGAYAQAITYVGRVLELEPVQEEAHRQMMSLLALTGQRGAALRQYNVCRRILADELGVEPKDETTALGKRIRDGGELDTRAPSPRHNLPTSLTPLIGREAELAEIVTRLQDPTCRLLTLVGPGGSGKTHLALEAANLLVRARRFADVFRDSVYWVSLAPLCSTRAIVPAMAQSLGFHFHAESEPRRQLLDYVRQRNLLLVMDNAEHLLASSDSPFPKDEEKGVEDLVSDVLKAAPGVKILVTSRARLNLRCEHLYPVTGMDVPPPPQSGGQARQTHEPALTPSEEAQEGLAGYSAVQLFLQSARRVQPGWELTDDGLADVARICRRVAGMPLGILLAASWVRLLSPAEIATHLSDRVTGDVSQTGRALDFLETDWRDVPARQRSMRAVFDRSWNLLTEREQEILAALSVFRGGFTYEAGRQVGGTSLRELMALMDRSLLHRTSSGRYEMHELLGQYAGEKLQAAPGAAKVAHDRHSAYYASKLQTWAADLKCDRQVAALEEIEFEIANARAAWDWMASQGDLVQVDLAMEGLCLFYEWRVRYAEGESACRAVVQNLTPLPSHHNWKKGEATRIQTKAQIWQSVFVDSVHAGQLLRASLALLDSPELSGQDTRAERAFALHRTALVVGETDHVRAQRLFEQSIALYQSLDDGWGMANALNSLGVILWDRAAYDEAKQLHEKSLVIYQTLGDQRGVACSLGRLGTLALFQGQLDGERLVRESVAIYQEIGDLASMADGFYIASLALMTLGAFDEAHSLLDENVAVYRAIGGRSDIADVLQSGVKVHLGQYEQGRAQAENGLNVAREIGDLLNVGFALIVLGWTALVREAYTKAQTLFQESVDVCRSIGHQEMSSWALTFLGYADRGLGRFVQAGEHFCQALQIAIEIQSFSGLLFALGGVVLLIADAGRSAQSQEERAVELYALASRHAAVANSRWFEDVVGRHVSDVAAALPPDVVAAAEERGRARDLDTTMAELLAELEEDLFQAP
jgi:predicted ATPase/DNA-binding SARP family transcriptional activator